MVVMATPFFAASVATLWWKLPAAQTLESGGHRQESGADGGRAGVRARRALVWHERGVATLG